MNERISNILNHPRRNEFLVGGSILTGTCALAYGIGYYVGRRMYSTSVVTVVEDKVEFSLDVNDAFDDDKNDPVIIDHDVYIKKGAEFVEEHLELVQTEDAVEVVAHNVFAGTDDEWDYDTELKKRTPFAPYILHKDEFYADERDYTQSVLTYYDGDSIMVDEDDKPIYNHNLIVGELMFGHGSGDPNVFYVRNEKLMAEYEITRDPGQYSVNVLGLEIENNERARDLKHSSVLKFRDD